MSDQFFDDEDDLASGAAEASAAKEEPPARSKPARAKGPAPEPAKPARKPPSTAMAVGIAVVALFLGICIGYFFAMSVVSRTGGVVDGLTSASSTSVSTESASSDASSVSEAASEVELPSNHPDISQFMNEDGSINQEAIDEYKAQRAVRQLRRF